MAVFREHVRVDAVLEVMTRVKMKSYYRAAVTAVRTRTTMTQEQHMFGWYH